jgi:hypothetical protein
VIPVFRTIRSPSRIKPAENNFELEIWYSLNLDVGVTSLMPIVLPPKKEL